MRDSSREHLAPSHLSSPHTVSGARLLSSSVWSVEREACVAEVPRRMRARELEGKDSKGKRKHFTCQWDFIHPSGSTSNAASSRRPPRLAVVSHALIRLTFEHVPPPQLDCGLRDSGTGLVPLVNVNSLSVSVSKKENLSVTCQAGR